jgi:hypothetical protein
VLFAHRIGIVQSSWKGIVQVLSATRKHFQYEARQAASDPTSTNQSNNTIQQCYQCTFFAAMEHDQMHQSMIRRIRLTRRDTKQNCCSSAAQQTRPCIPTPCDCDPPYLGRLVLTTLRCQNLMLAPVSPTRCSCATASHAPRNLLFRDSVAQYVGAWLHIAQDGHVPWTLRVQACWEASRVGPKQSLL